jgi:hypothetical protein
MAATSKKSTAAKKTTTRKKTTAKKTPARKKSTRKYSAATSDIVATELHEMKGGKLRSGGSGKKVTSREQAIAIGLSEARRAGKKAPPAPKRKS